MKATDLYPKLADRPLLVRLYDQEQLSTREIADRVGHPKHTTVADALRRLGIPVRSDPRRRLTERSRRKLSASSSREGNARWNGGTTFDGRYRLVLARGHGNANTHGYVYEHRLVMSRHLGRPLLRSEIVHHRNLVRTDNRLANLDLFTDSAAHSRMHSQVRRGRRVQPSVPPPERRKRRTYQRVGPRPFPTQPRSTP